MGRKRKDEVLTPLREDTQSRAAVGCEESRRARRAATEALRFVRAREAAAPWYFQRVNDFNKCPNKKNNEEYDD